MRRILLDYYWSNLRLGLAGVAVLAVGAGLISAWLTPRGPVTTSQALGTMAAALLVGTAAGLVMGNRWSMLVAPIVFAVTFEFARSGIDGPTVDAIHLGSTYGFIAFVVGCLFHGVLVLAPMIVGARYGVEFAARLGNDKAAAMHYSGCLFGDGAEIPKLESHRSPTHFRACYAFVTYSPFCGQVPG